MIARIDRSIPGRLTHTATNSAPFPYFKRSKCEELVRFFAKAVTVDEAIRELYLEGMDLKAIVTRRSVVIAEPDAPFGLGRHIDHLYDSMAGKPAPSILKVAMGYVDSVDSTRQMLEETKGVLSETLKKVMVRQEEIDRLVESSEQLSVQSKRFYRRARRANSRCFGCVIA